MPTIANQFVQSVLDLQPHVAVFDCDGTLWTNNAGEDFFYWSLGDNGGERIVSEDVTRWARARYADYLAGHVDEDVMCGEMATMYRGLRVMEIEAFAKRFIKENVCRNIFPDMRELTRQLSVVGCELWAVSSTNEWVIRAGLHDFPFPGGNILTAAVTVNDGVASGDLIRVPTGPTKATAIREFIAREVDLVFGNSLHDAAMLALGRRAFAVNPNPDLEELARRNGWTVYWPQGTKAASVVSR